MLCYSRIAKKYCYGEDWNSRAKRCPLSSFFRPLPPVRSVFSPEGRNLRAFPFILSWPELLSTQGWGFAPWGLEQYWAPPHSSMWCPLPLLSYALRKSNCRAVQKVTRIFLVSQEVLICSTGWLHLFHRWRSTLLNVWGQRCLDRTTSAILVSQKRQMLALELPTALSFRTCSFSETLGVSHRLCSRHWDVSSCPKLHSQPWRWFFICICGGSWNWTCVSTTGHLCCTVLGWLFKPLHGP